MLSVLKQTSSRALPLHTRSRDRACHCVSRRHPFDDLPPDEQRRLLQQDAGRLLRKLRLKRRLSQQELADKIGVHVTTIHDWEHGKYSPVLANLMLAVRALGMSLCDFERAFDRMRGLPPVR